MHVRPFKIVFGLYALRQCIHFTVKIDYGTPARFFRKRDFEIRQKWRNGLSARRSIFKLSLVRGIIRELSVRVARLFYPHNRTWMFRSVFVGFFWGLRYMVNFLTSSHRGSTARRFFKLTYFGGLSCLCRGRMDIFPNLFFCRHIRAPFLPFYSFLIKGANPFYRIRPKRLMVYAIFRSQLCALIDCNLCKDSLVAIHCIVHNRCASNFVALLSNCVIAERIADILTRIGRSYHEAKCVVREGVD